MAKAKGKQVKEKKDDELQITYEIVLDYLRTKGYRENLIGTKKLAYFVFLCYQSRYVKNEPRIDYSKVAEETAKKFKCDKDSVAQNSRYQCVTKFPNKSRSDVINIFLEELKLRSETNRETIISESKVEYFQNDSTYRNVLYFLSGHDFDLVHSLDIFVERPKYSNAPSTIYEVGIMDSKGRRVVLRTPSALTLGEGARNRRLADIYYCFDIIRYIYQELKTGKTAVQLRGYCELEEFFQGPVIGKFAVE